MNMVIIMNKLGLYAWFGGNVSIKDRFDAIKKAKFDCVSLYWGNEYEKTIGKNDDTINLVQNVYHLEVENLHAPYATASDLFSDDEALAQKTICQYLKTIQDAKKYHVPVIIIHLTGDIIDEKVNKKGISRIKTLVDEAIKCNVKLAFENLKENGLNHLYAVLETYQEPCVGFCYDLGHANLYKNTGVFDLLYKYKKRLFATHLHGNYQDFDCHNRIIDSNIDLNELKKVFQDIQIKCPLSLEVIQPLNFNSNNELNEYVLKLKDDLKLLV